MLPWIGNFIGPEPLLFSVAEQQVGLEHLKVNLELFVHFQGGGQGLHLGLEILGNLILYSSAGRLGVFDMRHGEQYHMGQHDPRGPGVFRSDLRIALLPFDRHRALKLVQGDMTLTKSFFVGRRHGQGVNDERFLRSNITIGMKVLSGA